jgi:hypothetical protein
MNRSRSRGFCTLDTFSFLLSHSQTFPSGCTSVRSRRPAPEKPGPRDPNTAGYTFRLACPNSYSYSSIRDGTLSFLRLAGPILCAVVPMPAFRRPGSCPLSRQPVHIPYYAAISAAHILPTRVSLNTSPVINIARIIDSSFLPTATFATFLLFG